MSFFGVNLEYIVYSIITDKFNWKLLMMMRHSKCIIFWRCWHCLIKSKKNFKFLMHLECLFQNNFNFTFPRQPQSANICAFCKYYYFSLRKHFQTSGGRSNLKLTHFPKKCWKIWSLIWSNEMLFFSQDNILSECHHLFQIF